MSPAVYAAKDADVETRATFFGHGSTAVDELTDIEPAAGISRRGVLAASTVVGGTAFAAGPLTAGEALAATTYRAVAYSKTPVLGPTDRHVVSRFSYGVTRALTRDVRRAGGAVAWFDRQLRPGSISDDHAESLLSWWPALSRSPQQAWDMHVSGRYPSHEAMFDLARWSLLRRVYSRRQLHEVMVEFWENALHVPAVAGPSFPWRIHYDRTIRTRALGSFADLLYATITHPSMLIYLDGAGSTAKAPNENLGRELLELHTVGHGGGYTEAHVKDSARILTGWRVDVRGSWEPYYDKSAHHVGPVTVMGFSDPNASSDGRDLTRRYLTYLATHPATAHRIARRLAVVFVSDNPPASLVDDLARVYLANETRIKPVLRALVRSAAFADAADKVRTPSQDVVGTYRALRIRVQRPTNQQSAANRILWSTSKVGQRVFAWPRPDGEPIVDDAWVGASRVLGSLSLHQTLAGGWYPTRDVTYRGPKSWIPEFPIRFDYLVDHMSRTVLGRRSTNRLLKACCQMTEIGPRERITRDHALVRWKMPFFLAALLDTPTHMTR